MVILNMKQARLKAIEIKNLFHYIQIKFMMQFAVRNGI